MLVLTRRIGERILIGDDVEVTILDIKGDSIRIGIDAPRTTRIQRAEIVEAVRDENAQAAVVGDEAEQALRAALAGRTEPAT
ncbi:carbon storage regulator CsrA [Microbacterium sp. JZ31]|uniref:carbon storage regulator CsrA n=1 Tax=Microbacterium sp. JZ31 TaxID=1906274 RepID=UPI001931A33B|nr:carbon storage regulator CsrA [Microbacterium sp. JZ31]